MRYLKKRPAAVLVFENVLKLAVQRAADAGKKRPVEQQHDVLTKIGFAGTWLLLNSKSFALVQSRPRVYMIYFHGG